MVTVPVTAAKRGAQARTSRKRGSGNAPLRARLCSVFEGIAEARVVRERSLEASLPEIV